MQVSVWLAVSLWMITAPSREDSTTRTIIRPFRARIHSCARRCITLRQPPEYTSLAALACTVETVHEHNCMCAPCMNTDFGCSTVSECLLGDYRVFKDLSRTLKQRRPVQTRYFWQTLRSSRCPSTTTSSSLHLGTPLRRKV